jgi:hypothetical protein
MYDVNFAGDSLAPSAKTRNALLKILNEFLAVTVILMSTVLSEKGVINVISGCTVIK